MQAKLWVSIDTTSRTSSAQATKVIETGFTPSMGMMVEDLAWTDARAVQSVYLSTDTPNVITIFMGRDDAESDSDFQQLVEMYRHHGWTVKVAGKDRD